MSGEARCRSAHSRVVWIIASVPKGTATPAWSGHNSERASSSARLAHVRQQKCSGPPICRWVLQDASSLSTTGGHTVAWGWKFASPSSPTLPPCMGRRHVACRRLAQACRRHVGRIGARGFAQRPTAPPGSVLERTLLPLEEHATPVAATRVLHKMAQATDGQCFSVVGAALRAGSAYMGVGGLLPEVLSCFSLPMLLLAFERIRHGEDAHAPHGRVPSIVFVALAGVEPAPRRLDADDALSGAVVPHEPGDVAAVCPAYSGMCA